MKTITLYWMAMTVTLPALVACNSSSGSNSEAPSIKQVHPMVYIEPFDLEDEIDMHLSFHVVVEDPDGYSDIAEATVRFPTGQSYDIDLTERLYERNGETGFSASFSLVDVAAGANGKELLMTGYEVTLIDKRGQSDTQAVDLLGFDGVEVPLGAYLVHPDDYPVSSGGDYIEGMTRPFASSTSITVDSTGIGIDVYINDERAYDLTFAFYDMNDDYIGQAVIVGSENLTLSGMGSYSIPFADIHFNEGYSQSDISQVRLYSGDKSVHQSGFSAYQSQQLAMSIKYDVPAPE
ncbi:hypothetical protein [Saccharospirillum alexandrii]|uniref:hypothetical protein n=1 Tax=Saccharospirillum alexandrii TaxID=2448477 RepID=UPI00373680B6